MQSAVSSSTGVHVDQPRQHDVVALPLAAEIEHHREAAERVAEQAGHQRRRERAGDTRRG